MKLVSILFLFLLCGCSGTYTHTLDFNPTEPLRVAVLPFLTLDADGNPVENEGRLILDNISLVSSELEETPAQTLRKLSISELQKSGLDVVSTALIDIDLPHRGFGKDDGTVDTMKVHQTSAQTLCLKFLDCDAVLYGKVRKWERSYYGIQSVNTVGAEIRIVSARSGKILFESKGEDSESRGITKIPTGLSSIVLEPIKGLDSEIIVSLAGSLTEKLFEPLDVSKRAEFLETAPPAIFAASHDASSAVMDKKHPLVVVMFGSSEQAATLQIVGTSISVPMIERSPGHYYGEYVPLPEDSFESAPINVSLTDSFGRSTNLQISKTPLTLRR